MLQAIISKDVYEALSAEIKKEYKAHKVDDTDTGKFILDVGTVDDFALENVKGVKSALSAERTSLAEAKKALEAFSGIEDVPAALAALKKVEEMKDWKPDDKVKAQLESLKQQLTDKHGGEMKTLQTQVDSFRGKVEQLMVESVASTILTEEGTKGNAKLLMPHIKQNVKVKRDDTTGEFSVEVLDGKGNVRISSATGSTDPMSIKEFVTEMRSDDSFAQAFEGTGQSGSGSKTPAGKPGQKGKTDTTLSPEARLKALRKKE